LFDASALCNNAHLQEHGGGALGQPTEAALLLAAHRLGVTDRRAALKRTHEVGFSSENKYMEVKQPCRPPRSAVSLLLFPLRPPHVD